MIKKSYILFSILILCISSCTTEQLLIKSESLEPTNNEKLFIMKAKQKVALIAVSLNIVEKNNLIGNENKIENLLRLSYNDTVYTYISDSIINCILKINLKNKFNYPDIESAEKHFAIYRTYLNKLMFEEKFSNNCFDILNSFLLQVKSDKLGVKQKIERKKASCADYKVKAYTFTGDLMEFMCPGDMYLLDAAEENGFNWPYSSRAGASYAELAQVLSGTVDNSEQSLLDDEEIAMGFILTDTSYPTSDVVIRLIPDIEYIGIQTDVYFFNNDHTIDYIEMPEVGGGTTKKITFNKGLTDISYKSIKILKDIMDCAQISSLRITSTTRSAHLQALAMYNNCYLKGVNSQKKLYSSYGDQVIDIYSYYKKLGYTMDFIVSKMESKINEIGPSNVSSHCGNASLVDVFDVAPSSVSNVEGFMDCSENNTSINDFLSPRDGDPAFHFKITK